MPSPSLESTLVAAPTHATLALASGRRNHLAQQGAQRPHLGLSFKAMCVVQQSTCQSWDQVIVASMVESGTNSFKNVLLRPVPVRQTTGTARTRASSHVTLLTPRPSATLRTVQLGRRAPVILCSSITPKVTAGQELSVIHQSSAGSVPMLCTTTAAGCRRRMCAPEGKTVSKVPFPTKTTVVPVPTTCHVNQASNVTFPK